MTCGVKSSVFYALIDYVKFITLKLSQGVPSLKNSGNFCLFALGLICGVQGLLLAPYPGITLLGAGGPEVVLGIESWWATCNSSSLPTYGRTSLPLGPPNVRILHYFKIFYFGVITPPVGLCLLCGSYSWRYLRTQDPLLQFSGGH